MKGINSLFFIFKILLSISTITSLIACKICNVDHHTSKVWGSWRKSTAPTRADQIPSNWSMKPNEQLKEGFPTICSAKYRISETANPLSDEQKAAGVKVHYEVKFAHNCQCPQCKTARANQLLRYHTGCFAPFIKFFCCTNPYKND